MSNKKRIYIAGPMRGKPEYNYPAFNAAAERLRAQGWEVENPVEISDRFCVRRGITDDELAENLNGALDALLNIEQCTVRKCHAIYLLRGWEKSVGAKKELAAALDADIEIILEETP